MSSEALDPLNLVGTTVAEKYAVEALVGEGGFAVVYRAKHLLWKRPVALKVFNALLDAPAAVRERLRDDFVREGALLAELSEQSAAICQARDVGMLSVNGRDVPYMVLEWLEGGSLEQVLGRDAERGAVPPTLARAITLLDPVAEALGLAHARGIAHRDVKPANVFVVGDPEADRPTVKLLDFGIAKVVQDAEKLGGGFTRTKGDPTSFTPAYGAPEQFARSYGSTGPWTDVFALALVFVEVVTGKMPLDGETLSQIAFASMNEARRPTPASLGLDLGPDVEAVLVKALAVKPTDRYPNAGAFWQALRAAAGQGPRVAESNPAIPVPSSRRALEVARTVAAPESVRTPPGPGVPENGPELPQAAVEQVVARTAPAAPSTARPIGAALLGAGVAIGLGVTLFVVAGRKRVHRDVPPPPLPASASAAHAAVRPEPTCPKDMVHVPGGSFFMGDEAGEPAEKPVHQVVLSPYCIGRLEVTLADYKKCSDAGECLRAGQTNEWPGISAHERQAYDPVCTARDPVGLAKHPVNCVSYPMAASYCRFVHARLPTEAEWEFAARGKDGRRYPWGDETPTGGHLNACGAECVAWGKAHHMPFAAMYPSDDGFPTTAPVGSFPPGKTIYGAEDMVGNVWEWVMDAYAPYEATPVGEPQRNPHGPSAAVAGAGPEVERVIRGGSWNSEQASWLRPSFRFHQMASARSHGIGFRCAESVARGEGANENEPNPR